MSPLVAFLTEPPLPDWGKSLWWALEKRGAGVKLVTGKEMLSENSFSVGWIRSQGKRRGLPASYWQAARELEESGVPILNSISSRILVADKWASQEILLQNDIPTPRTWRVSEGVENWNHSLICKPRFGSNARDVCLVKSQKEAQLIEEDLGEECIVQEYIRKASLIRLIATRERVLAAYQKSDPASLAISIQKGAKRIAIMPSDAMIDLARRTVSALGADLLGLDLLENEKGDLSLLEANGSFAFDAKDKDLAGEIARVILELGIH